MQQSFIASVRKSGIKYVAILLVWTLCLLFVLKLYSQESLYTENSAKIRRQSNYKDFLVGRKLFENFTQTVDFPELRSDTEVHELTYAELITAIEKELPSLPFQYWFYNESKKLQKSKDCSRFANLLQLNYYNTYWQTFHLENITFQLYSAYYDNRPTVTIGPTVRLIAMVNTTQEKFPALYCQLWYDKKLQPVITKVVLRMIWYASWGKQEGLLYPYLVTCILPTETGPLLPKVVSLISHECERARNSLRVHYEKPPVVKQQFAVCVKGLDYPNQDISARLVEWIELQQLLGAHKIYFYHLQVHPNVSKVLQYYTKRGIIDVKHITFAKGAPNTPQLQHYLLHLEILNKRLNELIPYNDCFYRNLHKYDYIALEDIDEVLMPLGNRTTWAELVKIAAKNRTEKCKNGYASYCFRNVYFPEFSNATGTIYHPTSVPSYMYMLEHVQRSSEPLAPNKATKCLHRTDQVMSLHNHFALGWLNVCPAYTFDAKVAQLHHYRHEDKKENLTESVRDMNIWRYKDVLLERTLKALEEMNFFKNAS